MENNTKTNEVASSSKGFMSKITECLGVTKKKLERAIIILGITAIAAMSLAGGLYVSDNGYESPQEQAIAQILEASDADISKITNGVYDSTELIAMLQSNDVAESYGIDLVKKLAEDISGSLTESSYKNGNVKDKLSGVNDVNQEMVEVIDRVMSKGMDGHDPHDLRKLAKIMGVFLSNDGSESPEELIKIQTEVANAYYATKAMEEITPNLDKATIFKIIGEMLTEKFDNDKAIDAQNDYANEHGRVISTASLG